MVFDEMKLRKKANKKDILSLVEFYSWLNMKTCANLTLK